MNNRVAARLKISTPENLPIQGLPPLEPKHQLLPAHSSIELRRVARAQLALERRSDRLSRRPGSARAASVARRPRSAGDSHSRLIRVRETASAERRETRADCRSSSGSAQLVSGQASRDDHPGRHRLLFFVVPRTAHMRPPGVIRGWSIGNTLECPVWNRFQRPECGISLGGDVTRRADGQWPTCRRR